MIPIRKAEVEDLLKNEHRPCLTLVLSPGVKEQGLPVTVAAYRALLRDAQKQCEKYHLGQIEMEELFAPLKLLESDTFFWKEHQHALIIYRSIDTLRIEHRVADWECRAIVDDIFHIRYLLVDAEDTLNFNLLLVAKNKAELYQGTKETLALNKKAILTQSKKDVTEASDNMRQQFHTATSSTHRGSGSTALYGGAGEDDDEDRQDLLRYLKHLDTEVNSALSGHVDPMILVGVEDTMTRYRKLSQYPHILEETLRYSDDKAKLHLDSLELLAKHRKDTKNDIVQKALDEVERPDGKISVGYNELFRTCEEGRIDTLFIALDEPSLRGYFDPTKLEIVEDDNGEELIERLVRSALRQGAHFVSGQETMAYLRY
jgi:hypothetical protein